MPSVTLLAHINLRRKNIYIYKYIHAIIIFVNRDLSQICVVCLPVPTPDRTFLHICQKLALKC